VTKLSASISSETSEMRWCGRSTAGGGGDGLLGIGESGVPKTLLSGDGCEGKPAKEGPRVSTGSEGAVEPRVSVED
jgi:hypothetical protein